MSTYAIGDVQGCFYALQDLLDLINLDLTKDNLWFTGDLVNRGPRSLETLRFVKSLGDKAITVLGNHDLHLLAVYYDSKKNKVSDTFQDILNADDCDELCLWLRQQKLFYYDNKLDFALVHAGLVPQWDLSQALALANEVEHILSSDQCSEFLTNMYGNQPDTWRDDLCGWARLRFITNCLTRIRYCDKGGRLDLKTKSQIGTQPKGFFPWFTIDSRKSKSLSIVFGHWAALVENWQTLNYPKIFPVDSGCVWGNQLTALRLEDKKYFSVKCKRTTSLKSQ